MVGGLVGEMFLEVRNPVGGGEERDPSRRGRDLTENWEAVGAQRGEAPAGLGAPHPFPACLTETPSPQPWVTILQPLPWTIPPPSPQPGRVKEGETPGVPHVVPCSAQHILWAHPTPDPPPPSTHPLPGQDAGEMTLASPPRVGEGLAGAC